MRTVLVIAANSIRRLVRDRSNLFFVFVFPLLLILLIGASFGAQIERHLAVYAEDVGPLGDQLVEDLDAMEDMVVDRYGSAAAATDAVSRQQADAALLLPTGYDQALREGRRVEARFVSALNTNGPALQSLVSTVVGEQAMVLAATRVVSATAGLEFSDALQVAQATVSLAPGVTVQVEEVGTDELAAEFEGLGQFDLGASQQLLLFVFLTSLTGGVALIQSREYGVTGRMLASPLTTRTIIAGEALGRFAVALVQGLYIIIGTLLLFRVDWGDPVGALAVLAAFSVPAAAAGLLVGSALDNQNQAAAVGIGGALGIGALGGAMAPLEVLPDTMRTVAHATPHAWGYDAYRELVRRDGSVLDVLPEIGVMLVMGLAILAIAAWALQRRLAG